MQAIQLLMGGGEESSAPASAGTLESFRRTSINEQGLLLPAQAAGILGISNQALLDLIARKRLRGFEFFGKTFVSATEVAERKVAPKAVGGRPRKQQLQAA